MSLILGANAELVPFITILIWNAVNSGISFTEYLYSLNSFAEYAIGYGNEFHITDMSGYNIKSSGFNIFGIADTVYLSDIPTDNRVGTLFLFKLDGRNSPSVVSSNVVTFDYDRAEILNDLV